VAGKVDAPATLSKNIEKKFALATDPEGIEN
jgi:hypothetical protein